jgi:carboxymethylenebutenolidase
MPSPIMPPGVVYHPAQIKAYDVKVDGFNGDKVPAYLARPSEEGIFPGLVLVHGVHGYEEHMKDVARRFAVMGYATIVPALYSRNEGLCVVEEEDMLKARDWLGNRSNAQANADLEAANAFLRASNFVGDRVGLVGFCSGGRVAMVFACNTEGLDAFVNFYSNGIFQPTEVNPTPAGEMVKDLCCPMLGLFGDDDTNPPPEDVARLRAELDKHGKNYEFVSYKNAAHAFFSDTRESYRPEASYMAWGRCLEWLSRYLKP